MRASAALWIPAAAIASAHWVRPDRIVAVTHGERAEVLVVDPVRLRLVSRVPLGGPVLSAGPTAGALVALVAPRGAIGPVRLAVVRAAGPAQEVTLEGIEGGWETLDRDAHRVRHLSPGLALDPAGRTAVVVAADRAVEVELGTLAVTRTTVLAERRPQKSIEGWARTAVWLGAGRVAVSGGDYSAGETSIGVQLVDVRRGSVSTLDAKASRIAVHGGGLLAWGDGLARFDRDGRARYRALAGEGVYDAMLGRDFLYVNDGPDRTDFRVVDPVSGRVLGQAWTDRPTTVLDF
jgi:hypothetical protein